MSRSRRAATRFLPTIACLVALNSASPAAEPVATPPEYSPEIVAAHLESARRDGNAHRGVVVFSSAKSACLSCHKIGRHGGSVGPDLTKVGKERKPAELVEAVLWPKRHVKPEYFARLIVTDDGRSHRGYLVRRNAEEVVLRDPTRPAAAPAVIPIDRIEAEREVGTLMPDNLAAAMSPAGLSDLLRFLMSLGQDNGVPPEQLDALLTHASAHVHGAAAFAFDRRPLRPEAWPSWQHHVNRDRVYDFYAKQADHFRLQKPAPPLLMSFPGLDGGEQGHWGNQNDTTWASDRWNETTLDIVQCGIFKGAGVTVPRSVCVQLGGDRRLAVCFNPDTLNYDAVWSGGFLKFSSFRHGFLHGVLMDGTAKPRPAAERIAGNSRYHGFYRFGQRTVFAYRIGDVEYLDAPGVTGGDFTRQRTVVTAGRRRELHEAIAAAKETPIVIETPITFGTGQPYAVDTIALPFDNPWKAQLFVGGLAFLPDGSAMVCTMQGDVWHVRGIQWPSKKARWTRFASGLHHALGMVIDDDGIFVAGRDQITRLHDRNQDGVADYYECFSNAFRTSAAGHDFICGLQRDRAGRFYMASGNQGIVRISADGRSVEVLATGFRNPDGLGLLPDGTVTVPCSEGSWTPASMICAVRPRDAATHHGARGPQGGKPPELPLVYLPRGIDNSAGGQTLVTSDRWGPLNGQLVHFSFGTGAHFLVLRDEIDGHLQGAVVPLTGEFRSGAHRGRFNPVDGQLYVGGMQGWGSYTPDHGCFQRVRYTGQPVQLPVAFRVHQNGIAVTFSSPVDESIASNPAEQFAQCWNYRYSAAYGSPEYSTRHYGMRGHDLLAIRSAHVMPDGKTVFLEIPDVQPANQIHLRLRSDESHRHELFVSAHRLADPFKRFPGYAKWAKTINPHPMVADLAMATRRVANPYQKKIQGARKVRLTTGTNLSFETRTLRARPGEPLELTLVNPDVVPHNWALIRPGSLRRVGEMANMLIADPEAAIRQYIPKSDDVLVHTDVVLPKDRFTIYFRAPKTPGRYPFLCTFPGHWLIMNGELNVGPIGNNRK